MAFYEDFFSEEYRGTVSTISVFVYGPGGARRIQEGLWRNGSASDSRSDGWAFESLWPHFFFLATNTKSFCIRFSITVKAALRRELLHVLVT